MIKPFPNHPLSYTIEAVYDKHAANMYGCIFKIVENKVQAEEILCSVFEELCKEQSGNTHHNTSPIWYIKYALKRTFEYLKNHSDIEYSSLIQERFNVLKNEIKSTVFTQA